ncbi:DUF5995 family protein [Streptomyces sp. NPDC048288]|uniref:DUF5995 family protein n=1 Tax=Streptomyces sp. NPDC048288 TaxID=3365529 RepID=UPI00371CBA93
MTAEIPAAVRSGLFGDGPRMDRFGTLFGNRYFAAFAAFAAWRRVRSGPRCRRGTFALLDDAGTVVVQHFVLGVNAHINPGLAVAAAQTGPGRSIHAPRHGFLLTGDILAWVAGLPRCPVPLVSLPGRAGAAPASASSASASAGPAGRPGTVPSCWPAGTRRDARPPAGGPVSAPPCPPAPPPAPAPAHHSAHRTAPLRDEYTPQTTKNVPSMQ